MHASDPSFHGRVVFVPPPEQQRLQEEQVQRGLHLARLGLASFVLLSSLLAFSAWIFGDSTLWVRRLADWDDNGVAMQANTALAMACAALALIVRSFDRRLATAVLGCVVLIIGGGTLLEHLLSLNSGLDTLLIEPTWGQAATMAPGRMGVPASTSYTLLAIALLASCRRNCERHPVCARVIAVIAMLVFAIASLAVVGWAVGAEQLHLIPRLTAIAMQTAVLLLCLSLATLTLSPHVEPLRTLMAPTSAGAMLRRTLPALTLIIVSLSLLRMRGEEAGLYSSKFGTALRTIVELFLLSGLVWWMARVVGRHEQDSTRRRDELMEQSVRMAAIVESTDDAIVSKDLSGTIRTWNRSAERIFGFAAEEAIGQHISLIIPRERMAEEDMVISKLRAGEKIDHFETKRMAKDGRIVDVSLSISPLRGSTGGIIGACKVARDITERTRTAKALRDASEREHLALRASGVALWEWNIRTGELRWDDLMFSLYGVNPTPAGLVRYETWANLVHPDDLPEQERMLQEIIRTGVPARREFRIRNARTGEIREMEAMDSLRLGEDGRPEWVAGTNLDVTERRAIERELNAHRLRLEEMVEQRTRQLDQAQAGLRRAERLAAMGTLAAGLGHDLRNIMLPVNLRLGTLSSTELSATAQEDVKDIQASMMYLERLANGLMQLAANPDAPGHVSMSGTNLEAWWCDAKSVVRSVLPRCVRLVTRLPWEPGDDHTPPQSLPPVTVHRVALTQAVFNLVQNAGEILAPRGRGIVTIEAKLHEENGLREVHLTVSDDGPGMSEDVASRCFEPYFSTKGRPVSTGMGLSLVRGVIEQSGGSVEVITAPGQGATFVLRLPTVCNPANRTGGDPKPRAALQTIPGMGDQNRKSVDR